MLFFSGDTTKEISPKKTASNISNLVMKLNKEDDATDVSEGVSDVKKPHLENGSSTSNGH